jgi:hypothetical protein
MGVISGVKLVPMGAELDTDGCQLEKVVASSGAVKRIVALSLAVLASLGTEVVLKMAPVGAIP